MIKALAVAPLQILSSQKWQQRVRLTQNAFFGKKEHYKTTVFTSLDVTTLLFTSNLHHRKQIPNGRQAIA